MDVLVDALGKPLIVLLGTELGREDVLGAVLGTPLWVPLVVALGTPLEILLGTALWREGCTSRCALLTTVGPIRNRAWERICTSSSAWHTTGGPTRSRAW